MASDWESIRVTGVTIDPQRWRAGKQDERALPGQAPGIGFGSPEGGVCGYKG